MLMSERQNKDVKVNQFGGVFKLSAIKEIIK